MWNCFDCPDDPRWSTFWAEIILESFFITLKCLRNIIILRRLSPSLPSSFVAVEQIGQMDFLRFATISPCNKNLPRSVGYKVQVAITLSFFQLWTWHFAKCIQIWPQTFPWLRPQRLNISKIHSSVAFQVRSS